MNFTFPNYKRNIINISATFAEFLSKEKSNIPTLKNLKKHLSKNYKNIVFIIFDGLGVNPIMINTNKNSILRKNIDCKLTSVFPSTTTNATSTLFSAQYPLEHCYLSWSLYFEDIKIPVDIYTNRNSITQEILEENLVLNLLPKLKPYYQNNNSDYIVSSVFPKYVKTDFQKNIVYKDIDDAKDTIYNICHEDGRQFIYCYADEPDATMHKNGVTSKNAKIIIEKIEGIIKDLVKIEDTLIVITADHGQVDIDENIKIYENKKLLDCLEWPLYFESRAVAFKVKAGRSEEFKKIFNRNYKKDFKLFTSDYLIRKGVFGPIITSHVKMLGDFIAVCKTNKNFLLNENSCYFKGHHSSLTKEIFVPLIIIGSK